MQSEFKGSITAIRSIEDAIRATHKYTEGITTMKAHPVQGGAFPSKVFNKHYEVYPDAVVEWDMSITQAKTWLMDTAIVRVNFWYNYRDGRAAMRIGTHAPGDDRQFAPAQQERAIYEEIRKLAIAAPVLCDLLIPLVGNDDRRSILDIKASVSKHLRDDWYMPEEDGLDIAEDATDEPKRKTLLDRLMPSRKKIT